MLAALRAEGRGRSRAYIERLMRRQRFRALAGRRLDELGAKSAFGSQAA